MRTVIINTLGSELRQNPLFYLPFRQEQFHWMEQKMEQIEASAQEISSNFYDQDQIQDYHLVVLVSLAQYQHTRYERLRNVYKDVLFAYLNRYLLEPLIQKHRIPPKAVSVVFVVPQLHNGDGNVSQQEKYDGVLGFGEQIQAIDTLALTTDDGVKLDVTELFQDAVKDYAESRKKEQVYDGDATENHAIEILRSSIDDRLRAMQSCSFIPLGEEKPRFLLVEKLEFCPRTSEWELFSVDLQMNLSNHLARHLDDGVWNLQLRAHDEASIQQAISLALDRVIYLRKSAPRERYYPLEDEVDTAEAELLTSQIWTDLQEKHVLPDDAQLEALIENLEGLDQEPSQTPDDPKFAPVEKLRRAWIRVDLEKKLFDTQCRILEEQYDPEKAKRQQLTILDSCAATFGEWRRKMLTRPRKEPGPATLPELPKFDSTRTEQALKRAQQEYGKASSENLRDYADVRQEAEVIKAKFRETYRFWPDGVHNPTGKFWIYSGVLLVLFLLQMMVPYIGITMGQEGVVLSRYVHFFLSLGLFVGLYLAGLLLWLNALCRQLHKYTWQMYELVQKSHACRRESIRDAVRTYGILLPQCTVCYEELQRLRSIHASNLKQKNCFNTHMQILDKAEEMLMEMHTLLRLPIKRGERTITMKGQINYQLPPSDPKNVPFYILLSEKWGC